MPYLLRLLGLALLLVGPVLVSGAGGGLQRPGPGGRQRRLCRHPARPQPGRDHAAGRPPGGAARRRRRAPQRLGRGRRRLGSPSGRQRRQQRHVAQPRPRPTPPRPARGEARRPGRLARLRQRRRRPRRDPVPAGPVGGHARRRTARGLHPGPGGRAGARAGRRGLHPHVDRRPPGRRHPGPPRPHGGRGRAADRLHRVHDRPRPSRRLRARRLGAPAAGPARRRHHAGGRRDLHRRAAPGRHDAGHRPRRACPGRTAWP